jgi:2,4-dienoyl-CoA reductase-like NADH-dependent reductase (Old Yellow Enzyme family)
MAGIFEPRYIRKIKIENGLALPPMVAFGFADESGMVSDRNVAHYSRIAQNGIGLIIVEATCISPEGRLDSRQLGIWDDSFIDGLSRISGAVHEAGSKVFIQLHHAGMKAKSDVAKEPFTSSDYDDGRMKGREMTYEEIKRVITQFREAAIRAREAGFDGVEIHGAHGYLLTQFFNSKVNKRTDQYGGTFENRNRLAAEIYEDVREACGDDFVIGIRVGSNDDNLEESIERARFFEKLGFDYLHVSTGFDGTRSVDELPEDFPCNWIVYGGVKIKENVGIPVIGVNMIKDENQIGYLLNNELLDFVALGRAQLADYNFVKHMRNNDKILYCLECKPCKWWTDGRECPRQIQAARQI